MMQPSSLKHKAADGQLPGASWSVRNPAAARLSREAIVISRGLEALGSQGGSRGGEGVGGL